MPHSINRTRVQREQERRELLRWLYFALSAMHYFPKKDNCSTHKVEQKNWQRDKPVYHLKLSEVPEFFCLSLASGSERETECSYTGVTRLPRLGTRLMVNSKLNVQHQSQAVKRTGALCWQGRLVRLGFNCLPCVCIALWERFSKAVHGFHSHRVRTSWRRGAGGRYGRDHHLNLLLKGSEVSHPQS